MLDNKLLKDAVRKSVSKFTSELEKIEESYVKESKPFDNKSVESISKNSFNNHEELYKGYIENLNKISRLLDTVDHENVSSSNSDLRSLKIDEVYNHNGAYLHELYFNNCYDVNSKVFTDSLAHMRLESSFGDFYKWQEEFISCGLSSREGWVVTGYSFYLKKCITVVIDAHSLNVPIAFIPLIVIDMWSHTYAQDFGIDKKAYLQSQMKELNWNVIEKRFQKLDAMLNAK
jgi:Fe-Mn family superoxide dismutase